MCKALLDYLLGRTTQGSGQTIVIGGGGGITVSQPTEIPVVVFPHPEEPFDPIQTSSTDIRQILDDGFDSYVVPVENRSFWRSQIDIAFSNDLPNPAWTWNDNNGFHLRFNVGWANIGTIFYEAAHVSWALLTDAQKTDYQNTFNQLKDTDPMMIALFKQYPHELVADEDTTGDVRIGGHAQTYRILGQFMPEELKQFYPKL
jgi:hypothetical protein